MKKFTLLFSLLLTFSFGARAQGHDIKINLKGCKDTMVFLVKYYWDQKRIEDTCTTIKNGLIEFKGKEDLEKGVYVLVSEAKVIYFDFFINENQKFTINSSIAEPIADLKSIGNNENTEFFAYLKYMSSKNQDFSKFLLQTKGKNKEDSTRFINEKIKGMNADVKKYELDFIVKTKGTFINEVLNLKTEKESINPPKASNGRPDSVYQYYYYKNHYFDGINFNDERIIRTPFFYDRVKKYFESVILMHPDTAIVEIDKLMAKCETENLVYNTLLSYFTYKYEQSKIMGFDKVFIHLADKYIISGKASKLYTPETVTKIKERADIMRNLLLEAKVADLYMIDTADGAKVRKMGFDTASSSKSVTDLYYKNIDRLTPLFKTLYSINSKFTILVFWAADCSHCQKEIPLLNEDLKQLKGKIDFQVFAVETKDELYKDWKKFIIEKKLDFINVYDPIHINNLKERFDIYSTPVIYILDKNKKIKAKRIGAEQVIEILKNLDKQP